LKFFATTVRYDKNSEEYTVSLKVASRSRIPPFIVMAVMGAANARETAGKDVNHLEVGQPGAV
jgi:hypothetical protein